METPTQPGGTCHRSSMYPIVGEVLGVGIGTHEVFVALGLLAALVVFAIERHRRRMDDPRLWSVVAVSLAWGALFMYLGTWFQHVDLSENAGLVEQFLYGNRSILGGLLGAYLGAHVGKRVTGYRARTGALFAPAVRLARDADSAHVHPARGHHRALQPQVPHVHRP